MIVTEFLTIVSYLFVVMMNSFPAVVVYLIRFSINNQKSNFLENSYNYSCLCQFFLLLLGKKK